MKVFAVFFNTRGEPIQLRADVELTEIKHPTWCDFIWIFDLDDCGNAIPYDNYQPNLFQMLRRGEGLTPTHIHVHDEAWQRLCVLSLPYLQMRATNQPLIINNKLITMEEIPKLAGYIPANVSNPVFVK